MYTYNESPNIIIELDDGETIPEGMSERNIPLDYGTCIEAIAYGATDFVELCNEGEPVCYGNAYAAYEFTAYMDGELRYFVFGPNEMQELKESRRVALEPVPQTIDELRGPFGAEYYDERNELVLEVSFEDESEEFADTYDLFDFTIRHPDETAVSYGRIFIGLPSGTPEKATRNVYDHRGMGFHFIGEVECGKNMLYRVARLVEAA